MSGETGHIPHVALTVIRLQLAVDEPPVALDSTTDAIPAEGLSHTPPSSLASSAPALKADLHSAQERLQATAAAERRRTLHRRPARCDSSAFRTCRCKRSYTIKSIVSTHADAASFMPDGGLTTRPCLASASDSCIRAVDVPHAVAQCTERHHHIPRVCAESVVLGPVVVVGCALLRRMQRCRSYAHRVTPAVGPASFCKR